LPYNLQITKLENGIKNIQSQASDDLKMNQSQASKSLKLTNHRPSRVHE